MSSCSVPVRPPGQSESLPAPLERFVDVFYASVLGILVSARAGDQDASLAMVDGLRALLPGSQ